MQEVVAASTGLAATAATTAGGALREHGQGCEDESRDGFTEPDVPGNSLEDQIAELETVVKSVKAVKDSDKGTALL